MKRYSISFMVRSDHEADYLERVLRGVLEKKLSLPTEVVKSKVREYRGGGAVSKNRPLIEDYMWRAGGKKGLKFTVEEIAEQVELPTQAVGKWLRRMAEEGILKRHYQVGEGPAEWELIGELPLESYTMSDIKI